MTYDQDAAPAGAQEAALAPVVFTPAAASRVQAVMAEHEMTGASVRVFVSSAGCSGLRYGMGFELEQRDDDRVFDSGGLSIVIDPASLPHLEGATVDFVEDIAGGAFKIDNPNAPSCGGCGSARDASDDGGCGGCCG